MYNSRLHLSNEDLFKIEYKTDHHISLEEDYIVSDIDDYFLPIDTDEEILNGKLY